MAQSTDQRARRFWIDPRFVLGVALVVASVVGVSALLAVQNRSVRVYAARSTLVAGDLVRAADLQLVSVRVPATSHYLGEGALPDDAIVVRSVPKGDLIPQAAVTGQTDANLTSIVVASSGPVAGAVVPGTMADVWSADAADDEDYVPPVVLVSGAVVVSVADDDSLVAGRGSVSVELRVPAGRVASVLQAMADGRSLSVVPSSARGDEPSDTDGPTPTRTPTPTAPASERPKGSRG
ncbi:hypothetical protein [Humibacter albus]|uniref:hypothetical protein n=1 Tax=Humibacter albus TaxID=427754 RepID=UPI0004142541|nr:hypothetical protein [Humibacter albus]